MQALISVSDKTGIVEFAQALHALMPHSTVLLMPHIGHLPMLEAPRRTARDYLQYRQALGKA